MTGRPEDAAASTRHADLAKLLAELDPGGIEIDSLGRITVKSAELREALRRVAAQPAPDTPEGEPPTNGSQCGCFNHTGCLPSLQ